MSFLNSDKLIVNINILGRCQKIKRLTVLGKDVGMIENGSAGNVSDYAHFWTPPELMIARSAWLASNQPADLH